MNKINKKTLPILILLIIVIFAIYKILIKKEGYLEIEQNNNITSISEYKNEIENDLSNTKEEKKNTIIVYVTGAIKNEGIYELEENSRIANVIEIAGGLTEEAEISEINLAYIIDDGMKIHIPKRNENMNEIKDNTNIYISRESNNIENYNNSNKTTQNSKSNTNIKNKKININTATQTELETLPGIGPSTALKIIEYRKQNGKFKKIEEISNINGIGENKYNKIKDLITL